MANASGAKITQGTRVAIVAYSNLRLTFTATEAVATVDRARVLIITIDGLTDTHTLFTMVSDGARITV